MHLNNMTTTKVPKLRFTEYRNDWIEERLGNLTKINQGLQIPISDRYKSKVPNSHFYITNEFLKFGSLKKYFIVDPPKSVVCDKNDILMTRTGNTGQVVTNVEGAFHNNFFKIKHSNSLDKDFLVFYLKLNRVQDSILRLAGTSTIPDLNHGDFYKIKFAHPSLEEQQKISSFLSSVDNLIANLEKQKKFLEKYKKGIMQKIFSREIRFKDEDGNEYHEWEEKRLGKIARTSKGKGISKADIVVSGKNKCIRYGELYTEYTESIIEVVSRTSINPNKMKLSKKNDMLMPTSDVTPSGLARCSALNEDGVIIGGDILIIRSNDLNNLFFSYYVVANRKQIMKLVTGVTVYHIYGSDMEKMSIRLPSKDEQQKISSCLFSIDKLIASTNKQVAKVNEWKKGLLQQMFV